MYEFKPITDRVNRLKERYRTTYPRLDSERAKIVTDFYRMSDDEMGIMKRAKTLYE
ncbi:MAG: hypothetical protein HGA49_13345, partial [Eubacteriaceae bacterium]|nr:hypothetical protein [Eubacteriaceae bacterium]